MFPILYELDLFGLFKEPWAFHSYGLMIAAGFLTAMTLTKRRAKVEGEDPDLIVDLCFYLLIAGLVGARIVFIMTKWQDYLASPLDILMFWRGGLVWYGGFLGGAGYVYYFCKKHRLELWKVLDILMPYAALGHGMGRIGCLAAGCCFGKVTDVAWGIVFPKGSMAHSQQSREGIISYLDTAHPIHPTQLYEFGAELAMFALLIYSRRWKKFHGQIFLTWVGLYPLIRSTIELFRGDKERGIGFMGISTSQYISIAVLAFAISFYFHLRKKQGDSPISPLETSPSESYADADADAS